jgi:hypothetical protein
MVMVVEQGTAGGIRKITSLARTSVVVTGIEPTMTTRGNTNPDPRTTIGVPGVAITGLTDTMIRSGT